MAFERHRKSAANLAALTSIQMANAILPLVAYPLILGTVGAVPYARIAVTESVAYVVLSLVIYSFDVEGVAGVAGLDPQHDLATISALFSDILFLRLGILALALSALLVVSPWLDAMTFRLLLAWSLLPLAYILQSMWFFQGLERNVAPAIAIWSSRVGCLVLLRVLITGPTDYYRAPLIIGATYAAAGAALLVVAIGHYGVRLRLPARARVRELLWAGKEIFLGNLSVTLYRDSNVLILNAVGTGPMVAVYSIAEKAVKVFQAGARPLNQMFFPKVIRALHGEPAPSPGAFWRVFRYTIPQFALLATGVGGAALAFVCFRERFPAALRSEQGGQIMGLIAIMTFSVFVGMANFMFGTAGLNSLNRRGQLARSILMTGVCSVVSCVVLVRSLGVTGAAMTFVGSEVLLFGLIAHAYFRPSAS